MEKGLESLTVSQLMNAVFKVNETPLIRPFHCSIVVADPSLLTPDKAPDGQWHIFFHSTFGVWHYASEDGLDYKRIAKICPRAMRPDINLIDGEYVLFYERTRPLFFNALNLVKLAKWKSGIYMKKSRDLFKWSNPEPVLTKARGYEKCEYGESISNPFYLNDGGVHRLYYSCGLTFIKDCGFCEPTYIGYAESKSPCGEYEPAQRPVISPDPDDPYSDLCSGCIKVYKLKDGYIGIRNGIYSRGGESRSAIMLMTSPDGISFTFARMLIEPNPGVKWMAQYVYASHLVMHGGELRLYFNARDTSDMIRGRECIGYASAHIKETD